MEAGAIKYLRDVDRVEGVGKRKRGPRRLLSSENEVLMTIKYCRRAWTVAELADQWGVSTTLVTRTVPVWLAVFDECRKRQVFVPHLAEVLKGVGRLPCLCNVDGSRYRYAADVVLIVDCTEYGVGSAPHAVVRNAMHSVYKGRLTCKVLYGMGPDGSTYYVSEGFDGSTTDIDVVKNSGFLDLLRQFLRQAEEMGRDLKARPLRILADRGFPLQALIDTELGGGIEVDHPAFLGKSKWHSAEEAAESQAIASVRVFIENHIGLAQDYKCLTHATERCESYTRVPYLVPICGWLHSKLEVCIVHHGGEGSVVGGSSSSAVTPTRK